MRALCIEITPHDRKVIRALIFKSNPKEMRGLPIVLQSVFEGSSADVRDWFIRYANSEATFGEPINYAISADQRHDSDTWEQPDALTVWESAECVMFDPEENYIEPPPLKIANDLMEAYKGYYENTPDHRDGEPSDGWATKQILKDSPEERLRVYLEWNGILGYHGRIWGISQGRL